MTATARHVGALAALFVVLGSRGGLSPSVLALAGSVGLMVCGTVALSGPLLRRLLDVSPRPATDD